MRKFDYSFLNNAMLPVNLINLTSSIASLKTMAGVRKQEYAKIFTELEAVAKVQSVKSSNAIEGIVTSDERIAAIVNQDSAPLNHTEGEIAGYRDALNAIHLNYDNLDLRQSDILRLHETMMQIAGYEYGGKYKTGDNYIIEEDKNGNRKVRFKPIPASEVEAAMEQLELAYIDARNDASINQLLLIPCVILDFLCIHPFRDGNGRMSRLLTLLLLYKNGYDAGKYVSFEEQINNWFNSLEVNWDQIIQTGIDFLKNGAGNVLGTTFNVAVTVINSVMNFVIGFVFACYILLQKEKLSVQIRKVLYAFFPGKVVRQVLKVASLSYKTFSNFVTGQCLEAVILGTMFFVVMSILKFPYAMLVGVVFCVILE